MTDVRAVDALGVLCPVPIIRLARAAALGPPGALLELWTDDPAAEHDVPAWCRLRGHTLLESTHEAAAPVPARDPSPGGTGPGTAHPEPAVPNATGGQVVRHLIRLGPAPGA